MIRLWFSAVHYWKHCKGKDGLTLPLLLACERIQRGESLTAPASEIELLRLLSTTAESVVGDHVGWLYDCPGIHQPVVTIYPLIWVGYYSSAIKWGDAFYADRALLPGVCTTEEAAHKLFQRLHEPLIEKRFWYDAKKRRYMPFGTAARSFLKSAKDYTALKFRR